MRYKLILYSYLVFHLAFSQNSGYVSPKFQNLSLKDGLSNLHVTSICQDEIGYIFIGTARGLNRFDGLTFKHYYYENEESVISRNEIRHLHNTYNNKIICVTSNGSNVYDPLKDGFIEKSTDKNTYLALVNHKGDTYASNDLGQLFTYDTVTNAMVKRADIEVNVVISELISDEASGLWGKSNSNEFLINIKPESGEVKRYPIPLHNVAMGGGLAKLDEFIIMAIPGNLYLFNMDEGAFVDIPDRLSGLKQIDHVDITFISKIEENTLWFGSLENGLFIYNLETNELINYSKTDENSIIRSNYLMCAFKDRDNNIWLGSFDNGLEIAYDRRKNFNFDRYLNRITRNTFITAITEDRKGTYYLGTRLNGILVYDSKARNSHALEAEGMMLSNHIRALILDSRDCLWFSSKSNLTIYDTKTKGFIFREIPKPNNGIVSFCEADGKMLVGTDMQGLLVYDIEGNLIKSNKGMGMNITQILPYGSNKFIISSFGYAKGLFEYFLDKDSFVSLNTRMHIPDDQLYEIVTCYFDSDSILWIGNFNFGLYRFDLLHDSVTQYNKNSGLPSQDITGIVEDQDGNLWISTAYGLSHFDKKTEFVNYFYNDGLENIQFHQKAAYMDEYGTIFFGGNFGVTYFNPQNLGFKRAAAPKPILKALRVSNILVEPNDATGILDKSLYYTNAIRLTHNYQVFSIEYHAFDFAAGNNIKYAYFLEGFHKDWNKVNDNKIASFSNLRPGDYIFKVRAQNNDGIWSEPSVLKLTIVPAPWKTIWAYLFYFFCISSIAWVIFRYILKSKIYKKELDLEHKERMREKEISVMKLRFFTNISHEIRTPLTLLKGNMDFLENELLNKNVAVSSMNGLKNSTNRLLRLVNQVLSFQKLESDALDLVLKKEDIVDQTRAIVESFKYAASSRNISLDIQSKPDSVIIPLDLDKYEKILSNLLSNALKFSHQNSRIKIVIEPFDNALFSKYVQSGVADKKYVEVSVIDHGKGINEELRDKIFDRFTMLDSNNPDYSGTGIGLNFTKRLIELHCGYITVHCKKKEETCFSFILPLEGNVYPVEALKTSKIEPVLNIENNMVPKPVLVDEKGERTILLAEDDLELNKFIASALSEAYTVYTAFNGKTAFSIAKSKLPDIIISDIMMPEMDGMNLCRMIRSDDLISHIPIILLTAKDDTESQIAGYEYGADDYITKPFDLKLLKVRIANVIHRRLELQKSYQKGVPVEFKKDEINKFELSFMKKLDGIIEENAHNPAFNVQMLADMLFMSRTSFYRKFLNITEISPKDYLTKFRIRKAIELMKNDSDSFGEISYMCGFSSQSVFSVGFKKETGMSPLQYKKTIM